jgi:phosphatidylglycerophosphate synthase
MNATATAVPTTREREPLRTTLGRLSTAQKGAAGAPAYSRFVNRRMGRLLAALAFRGGLTPNVVTLLSACCTFAGIVVLAGSRPSWSTAVVVTLPLLLGYALDSADGQLARLTGGGSPAGEWLDHVVDSAKTVSLPLALLLSLYRFRAVGRVWLVVPMGFAVVAVTHLFATLLNEQLRRNHGVQERAAVTAERPSVVRSLIVLPTDYGFLALSFGLLGAPTAFMAVYTFLFVATAGYLALASVRWFREMGQLAG